MRLIERVSDRLQREDDDTSPPIWRMPELVVSTEPGAASESELDIEDCSEPESSFCTISAQTLSAKGLIVPGGPRTRSVHEYRVIKRSLLLSALSDGTAASDPARRIMITSALPGEGKTFTAANLALSLAEERDYSVLLVDGDVARPSLPGLLGIEPRAGLMDALIDPGLDLTNLIRRTSFDKLSFLGAGTPNPQATELIASDAMAGLVDRLTARNRRQIVVFDSPPLLVTTEASSLAPHMGQIIVVVETGKTPRAAVQDALRSLRGYPASPCVLLNKAPQRRGTYGYGAYGYGAYGYGESDVR